MQTARRRRVDAARPRSRSSTCSTAWPGALYADSEVVTSATAAAAGRPTPTSAAASTGWPGPGSLGVRPGDRVGDLLLEHAGAPRGLPRRALHGRGPAHAQHPPVRRAARRTSSTTPRTGRASSTTRWCRSLEKLAPTLRDRRARRRDGRRRRGRAAERDRATRSCSPPRSRASTGPSSTSARPRRLCYTSGTTGNPKGVLYSHRSTVLHALGAVPGRRAGHLRARDRVLPVVPMFHANAWGLPYACGAGRAPTWSCPAAYLQAEPLAELIESERVTIAGAVPDDLDGPAALRGRARARPLEPARSWSAAARPCPRR